jgi:Periplasmic protease
MKKLLHTFVLLAFLCAAVAGAGDAGWFGFRLGVDGSGFINPIVKSVTVQEVLPGSPAAKQPITVGDEVIEIEGTPVPGHRANELKPLMGKKVGEVLHLRLKRVGGEIYSVTMTAAKRPG